MHLSQWRTSLYDFIVTLLYTTRSSQNDKSNPNNSLGIVKSLIVAKIYFQFSFCVEDGKVFNSISPRSIEWGWESITSIVCEDVQFCHSDRWPIKLSPSASTYFLPLEIETLSGQLEFKFNWFSDSRDHSKRLIEKSYSWESAIKRFPDSLSLSIQAASESTNEIY